jgi:hypothetical protein
MVILSSEQLWRGELRIWACAMLCENCNVRIEIFELTMRMSEIPLVSTHSSRLCRCEAVLEHEQFLCMITSMLRCILRNLCAEKHFEQTFMQKNLCLANDLSG